MWEQVAYRINFFLGSDNGTMDTCLPRPWELLVELEPAICRIEQRKL
jgi:hypothetical protein